MKEIPNYPKYFVNEIGEIFSTKKSNSNKNGELKKLKLKNEKGYLTVFLSNRYEKKNLKVHRLVAQLYIPNPENKPYINHKNGIKDDNRVENLEWCTHSENVKHSFSIGTSKVFNRKPVIQCDLDGNIIAEFTSFAQAQRITGVYYTGIALACKGRYKQAGGYKWKHA